VVRIRVGVQGNALRYNEAQVEWSREPEKMEWREMDYHTEGRGKFKGGSKSIPGYNNPTEYAIGTVE